MKIKNKWWAGIAGLMVALAALLLIKNSQTSTKEKPPKKAPQLDIENPGSQDDFPIPPMESEIG